jgi:hypothetical protein
MVDHRLAHKPGTYRLPGWHIAARTLHYYGRTHVLELLVVGIALNSGWCVLRVTKRDETVIQKFQKNRYRPSVSSFSCVGCAFRSGRVIVSDTFFGTTRFRKELGKKVLWEWKQLPCSHLKQVM